MDIMYILICTYMYMLKLEFLPDIKWGLGRVGDDSLFNDVRKAI